MVTPRIGQRLLAVPGLFAILLTLWVARRSVAPRPVILPPEPARAWPRRRPACPLPSRSSPQRSRRRRCQARRSCGTGTGALAVSFALSGTATPGTDYIITGASNPTTGTTITLNTGATATKDVVVTPTTDATAKELETITLTLTPSSAYSHLAGHLRRDDVAARRRAADGLCGHASRHGRQFHGQRGTVSNPTKFYVSRTGGSGTASAGADYTACASKSRSRRRAARLTPERARGMAGIPPSSRRLD